MHIELRLAIEIIILLFLDYVKKRFGSDSFDMKILKRKCNQKCRDAEQKLQLMKTNTEMGLWRTKEVNMRPREDDDSRSTLEDEEQQSTNNEIEDLGLE